MEKKMTIKQYTRARNEILGSNPFGDDHPTETYKHHPVFNDKPFWCNNRCNKIDCCFNHIVGLPQKNGIEHPMYDYEDELYRVIESNQHVWCKKARGIGFTTFLIRYIAYKALVNDELSYKSVFIIAGTRVDFANEIKNKMEQLFPEEYKDVIHDSKYTLTFINKTRFKVFPT